MLPAFEYFINIFSLNNIDMFIVAIYLILNLLIGFKYSRKVKSITDYAVADRNYHDVVIVATMFATMVGGFSAMGVAGYIHKIGIIFAFASSGWIIQNLIDAFIISKNLHKFKDCISCGGMIKVFYGTKGQVLAGISVFLTIAGSISAQIMILGNLFEYLFHIDYTIGLIISALVVILYSASGGVKAVTMTDLLQFGILIIAIPIIASEAIIKLGGYHNFISQIPDTHLNLFPDYHQFYFFMLPMFISNLIPFYPEMAQRILINKNASQFKRSMLKVVSLEVIFVITITIIGLAAAILYPEVESKNIIPFMIQDLIPVGLKGLVIAGLFAVVMSTTDSMLNTVAVSVTHDIIGNFKEITPKIQLKIARIVTIIIGFSAIIIASKFDNILEVILKIGIIWSCTFKIPLCAALFNIKISEKGLVFTVIIGFFALIFGQLFLDDIFSPLLFGILVNFITFFSIYFLTRKTQNTNSIYLKLYHIFHYFITVIIKAYNFFSKINFKDFIFTQCHKNAYIYHNEPRNLAIYTILSWFIFLGNVEVEKTFIISLIRSSTGLIAFFLFFHDIWVEKYKKYFPLYWFFSLIYILVFIPTTTLFASKFDLSWFINYGLCLLLLAMMTNGTSFIYILLIGSISSLALCNFIIDYKAQLSQIHESVPPEILLLYLLVIVISAFFIRNKESRFEGQIKSLATQLQISRNISEEALKIRKEIFKNFTHEFNTPLQSMSSLIDFTQDINNMPIGYINNIANNVKKNMEDLSSFVHELNDVINEKNILLRSSNNFNTHNIESLIRQAIASYNKDYNYDFNYNITVKNNLKTSEIICDAETIQKLIIEIIANSVKFSKEDIINTIDIKIDEVKGENQILISITDTGIGVPEKELLNIFEPLFIASNNNFNTERKGMGLSICKSIVSEHNGLIWAENYNEGLTIKIRLPIKPYYTNNNNKQNIGLLLVNEDKSILTNVNIITGETMATKTVNTSSGIDTLQLINENINIVKIIAINNKKNVPFLDSLLNVLEEDTIYQNIYKIIL